MSYPAAGGPSAATVRRAFERLSASGRVAAVSLSAWHTSLDKDGQSRDVCLELLRALL